MGDCPTGILIDLADLKEEKSDAFDFSSILPTFDSSFQKSGKMTRREPPCDILVDITNKSPFKTPVKTPKKKDVRSSYKSRLTPKKWSPEDNDISLLENEVFDFDLKSPTAGNEESEDEVFFGPIGLKESLVAHSRRLDEDDSETDSFGTLSAKEMVEVFKEATEVAVRIQAIRDRNNSSSGFDVPKLVFDNLSPISNDDSDALDSARSTLYGLAPLGSMSLEKRTGPNVSITKDVMSQTNSEEEKCSQLNLAGNQDAKELIISNQNAVIGRNTKDVTLHENNNTDAAVCQENVAFAAKRSLGFNVMSSPFEVVQEEGKDQRSKFESDTSFKLHLELNNIETGLPISKSEPESLLKTSFEQSLDSVQQNMETSIHYEKLNDSFCLDSPMCTENMVITLPETEGNIVTKEHTDDISEEKQVKGSLKVNSIKRRSNIEHKMNTAENSTGLTPAAKKTMSKHSSSPILFRVPKSKITQSSTPRIERSSISSKTSNSPNVSLIDSCDNDHGTSYGSNETPGSNCNSSRIPLGNSHSRIPSLNSSQLSSRSSQEKNTSVDSLCSEFSYKSSSSESSVSGSRKAIPQSKLSGLQNIGSYLRKPIHRSSASSTSSVESRASEKKSGTTTKLPAVSSKLQSIPLTNIEKTLATNRKSALNTKVANGPIKAMSVIPPSPKPQSIRRSQSLKENSGKGPSIPVQQSCGLPKKAGTPKITRATSFTPTQQRFVKPSISKTSSNNCTPNGVRPLASSHSSVSTPSRLSKAMKEGALPKSDLKVPKFESTTRKVSVLPTRKTYTKTDCNRTEGPSKNTYNK